MRTLHILEIKPLSEVSLANIFSHLLVSLFILLMFSLPVQKLFNLFMTLALGDILVKIFLYGISEIFLPMFSCRTFMVSRLIFKSFVHLEFVFVYHLSWWSNFIFLHVAVQVSQHYL